MFSIYLTLYHQKILIYDVLLELNNNTIPKINSAPYFSSYAVFHEIQSLRNFILNFLPSAGITISTAPVLRVDKANANDINTDFTELVKESNLDYNSHENVKDSHITNECGLLINTAGSSIIAKN